MINMPEFRAAMARKNYTQKSLAKELGISEQTFRRRLNKGVFGTDEVLRMVDLLDINDPCFIFLFSK